MRNFFLLAAATQVQNLKIESSIATEASAQTEAFAETDAERSSSYPGQPYRPPYLEKVVKELAANLKEQIPDSIPESMNNLLCDFETEDSKEWKRLECDKWAQAKIDP